MRIMVTCVFKSRGLHLHMELVQGHTRLASTDIAEHALQQLRSSQVEEVSVIGRRGPVQVGLSVICVTASCLQGMHPCIRTAWTLLFVQLSQDRV